MNKTKNDTAKEKKKAGESPKFIYFSIEETSRPGEARKFFGDILLFNLMNEARPQRPKSKFAQIEYFF